ncbi:Uncharacterized protein FWK35_00003288 [Aphis craccivora]|uniref:HAT C-terminal dimerisation domain-containing protein n=1 Tax=Aphis craccivora TaxID=307492 RepID=A0A6G0ZF97_APHCR|nr:Uncharacterized protein FWK35_00003288 [Aphis craccivora]
MYWAQDTIFFLHILYVLVDIKSNQFIVFYFMATGTDYLSMFIKKKFSFKQHFIPNIILLISLKKMINRGLQNCYIFPLQRSGLLSLIFLLYTDRITSLAHIFSKIFTITFSLSKYFQTSGIDLIKFQQLIKAVLTQLEMKNGMEDKNKQNYDDPIKDAEQKFTVEVQPKILQWLHNGYQVLTIAYKYLYCFPVTEVVCERSFFILKYIENLFRSKLTDEILKHLC